MTKVSHSFPILGVSFQLVYTREKMDPGKRGREERGISSHNRVIGYFGIRMDWGSKSSSGKSAMLFPFRIGSHSSQGNAQGTSQIYFQLK